jgi:hypothetical protein
VFSSRFPKEKKKSSREEGLQRIHKRDIIKLTPHFLDHQKIKKNPSPMKELSGECTNVDEIKLTPHFSRSPKNKTKNKRSP